MSWRKTLAWLAPVEGLPRPVVEFVGDGVEIVLAVCGQVGAFGEVLPEQPVGVLVGASLPGAVRVAEVDPHVQCGRDLAVQRELGALVPGQRVKQRPGQRPHLVDDGLLDVFDVVTVDSRKRERRLCPSPRGRHTARGALARSLPNSHLSCT